MNGRLSAIVSRICEIAPVHYLKDVERVTSLAKRWCERQRAWHGPSHLFALLEEIAATESGEEKDVLLIAALYHDAIYDPRAADNEEASAQLLEVDSSNESSLIVKKAADLIRASKWDTSPVDPLTLKFFRLDTYQLSAECPISERILYEQAIFREYQFAPWATYHAKRREFLENWKNRFPEHRHGVDECLEILHAIKPRIALYPGSFNPFHHGHLSILRQAEMAFDKVIIGLGVNRQKAGAAEALSQRHTALQERLRYHEVTPISGLVTSFIEDYPLPVTVVRGVRDGTDLEAELRYSRFLNELRPKTNVVWIACESNLQHLSSSSIRELDAIEPGAALRYLPNTTSIYGEDGL